MLKNIIPKTFLFCLLLSTLAVATNAQTGSQIYIGGDLLPGDDNTSARFQLVNRFELNPRFSAGVGAGFTYYNDPLSLLPVFAELNFALTPGRTAPYLFLRSGYNFSILTDTDITVDEHRGGLMFNPGIGLKIGTKSGIGLHLSVGYSLDKSQFKVQQGNERTIETDITYKRLMAGFGLTF